jgi:uncharacterized protein
MQSSTIGPVTSQERIQTIDIIRGFALFGILIINFTVDSTDIKLKDGFGDQFVYWSVRLFMDDRFQSIYCFLFGLGFALQMQRAASRNSFFGFAYLRRMIILFLIGSSLFILTGQANNVLPDYAQVGILLLLFWKVPTKLLPLLAVFFFLLPLTRNSIVRIRSDLQAATYTRVAVDTTILNKYVGEYMMGNQRLFLSRRSDTLMVSSGNGKSILTPLSDTHFLMKNFTQIFTFHKDSSGKVSKLSIELANHNFYRAVKISNDPTLLAKQASQQQEKTNSTRERKAYKQFVIENTTRFWNSLRNWTWKEFLWSNYKIGYILVLFLLGMYMGRRKIFHDVAANREFLIKTFKSGMIIGGMGILIGVGFEAWNFIYNINSYSQLTRIIMQLPWNIGRILMALAIIVGIALLIEKSFWEKRLNFFATIGRMGLTNYSLQLFAYLLLFDDVSWFGGLDGKIGILYKFLFSIPVYLILYFFSRWWLKHFRYGPFEWLWRSLTYLKFRPMKLSKNDIGQA